MAFMWFFPSFCILSVIFSGLFNCPRAMEELDMPKLQDALNIRAPLLVLLCEYFFFFNMNITII